MLKKTEKLRKIGEMTVKTKFQNMVNFNGRIPIDDALTSVIDLQSARIIDDAETDRFYAEKYRMGHLDFARYQKLNAFQKYIDRRLRAHGLTLDKVGRVNVVYCHPNPKDNSETGFGAQLVANSVIARLQQYDAVEAVRIDAIFEQAPVNGAELEDKDALIALTSKQAYGFDADIQDDPQSLNEYERPEDQRGEFFIIVDASMNEATSLAHLYSHIAQNGGTVLAAVAGYTEPHRSKRFAQKADRRAYQDIEVSPQNRMARVPEMAKAFKESAEANDLLFSADECADLVNRGLDQYGMSLAAMTNAEVDHLLKDLDDEILDFPKILKRLNVAVP